jgi:heparan-alpha-glucosaminide N-acetyltransferase
MPGTMATVSQPSSVAQLPLDSTIPLTTPRDSRRLLSLDAFRGLTMLLLISHGFGLYDAFRGNPSASWIASQFDHATWVGCTFWDLIQPAFTFIVGVAMPLSLARRMQEGNSRSSLFKHVLWRAFFLLALSNVLSNWNSGNPPVLQLINVLCQIAFSYVICFAIMQLRFTLQVVAAVGLMVLHAGLFFVFPGPAGPFDPTANIGAVIDRNILGYNYSGNYTTINFLGNAVTVLFGVWTGMLLASARAHYDRLRILGGCAAACFALGLALQAWIPMVKRLWTPSFTFFSSGWVLLSILAIYWVVEVKGWKRWTFPAVVVGTNCIFIYAFSQVLRGWLSRGLGNFTGQFWFLGPYGAIPHNLLVTAAMWYLCYWLYERKIFFKI